MYFRYFILWAAVVGLLVKFAYVLYFRQLSWARRLVMDFAMNAASSLLNLIALPIAWLVWAIPRLTVNQIFGTDDADPINWIAILLIIAIIGALSEALVIHFAFKQRLGQRGFWLLCMANAVCSGTAACGMGFYMVATRLSTPTTAQLFQTNGLWSGTEYSPLKYLAVGSRHQDVEVERQTEQRGCQGDNGCNSWKKDCQKQRREK
jgi:hypothetical protein